MENIEDTFFYAGHRERLRQKFLDNQITDYETLELLLCWAIPRRDVRPLSRVLLKKFGGIHQILCASMDELTACPGIGRNTAISIKLVQRLMLCDYKSCLEDEPIFHNKKILENYCRTLLLGKNKEEFYVLYLGKDKRLLECKLHGIGTVNEAPLYPREILQEALKQDAAGVVLLHNHPSSQEAFSDDDIFATEKLRDQLKDVGVILYDHYLVAGGMFISGLEQGFIKKVFKSENNTTE